MPVEANLLDFIFKMTTELLVGLVLMLLGSQVTLFACFRY